ncbi:MAG: hypothetical protein HYR60_30055 [Acidobacteria bacterium]|nr:hypothetical protein [Acidobacteriota bacterium]MBI3471070.1 hypothetical protein [Candidatus Solibacter usitatus]
MRKLLGAALLLFQAGMIVYARFVPSRYFCWAPFDMQTEYALEVTVNGRELSAGEIRRRYRRPRKGVDNRSAQHVIDIIEGYERNYGSGEHAQVVMRYRINGKPEQVWNWGFGE